MEKKKIKNQSELDVLRTMHLVKVEESEESFQFSNRRCEGFQFRRREDLTKRIKRDLKRDKGLRSNSKIRISYVRVRQCIW
jgi:hypothetical protein